MTGSEKNKRVASLLAAVASFSIATAVAGPATDAAGPMPEGAPLDDASSGSPVAEVVVTGSHIRGADVAPVVNVEVVDQAQLQQSGATQMADVIKILPSDRKSVV